jgi:hypothetical protein
MPLFAKYKIVTLLPMTFLGRSLKILFCCLLAGKSGCALAQLPQQQINRHAPFTAQQSSPIATSQPYTIQQAAHTSATSSQPSRSSSELYKPWNLGEFPIRSNDPQTPYRLVSDAQLTDQKTPPPPGGLQHLLAPRTAPERVTAAQPVSLARRIMPILGIGQYLRDEFRPSNNRNWKQNHAVLQTAEFNGNFVTIRNVRFTRYESLEVYTTQHYDATFNLDTIRTIDLIMVPFRGTPRLAHVISSFGFADGRHIGLSIETRYEEGERYDPLGSGLRQFELMYVFADERDMIRLEAEIKNNDVYIYRLNFEPGEVRAIFVDALQRANQLAAQPEFYHPVTNNCVTNLLVHINRGRPNAVPRSYRSAILPGLLDNYMYDLGLIVTPASTFREAKEIAKINWLIERYGDLEYFSAGIRQKMH